MPTINKESAARELVRYVTSEGDDLEALCRGREALEDYDFLVAYFGSPVGYDTEEEKKTPKEARILDRAREILDAKIEALADN